MVNNKKKIAIYLPIFCAVAFVLFFLITHSFSLEKDNSGYEYRKITTIHARNNPVSVKFNEEFYKNFGNSFSKDECTVSVILVDRKKIERILTLFLNIVEYKKTGFYIRVWDKNEEIHEINLNHLNFWSKWKVRFLFFV